MGEYELRIAEPSDAEALSGLIRRAMKTYRAESGITSDVLESLHESVETVADRIRHNRCLCFFDEDKPVATITLSKVDNPMRYSFSATTEAFLSRYTACAYISRFAVADELRGTGLGVKLMEAALSENISVRTGLAILHTAVANVRMNEFYANRGFKLLDSEESRGYERGLYVNILRERLVDKITGVSPFL
ncbi:MAG: GNAT family N-acetyltransferase [Clostridiales bacterium]|nr:GNAT family N-acetyltransferase [Clostridiales bacterium]